MFELIVAKQQQENNLEINVDLKLMWFYIQFLE